MCCFDTAAADLWKHGHDGWKKKCCNNPTGSPVIRPTQDLDEWEIKKVTSGNNQTKLSFYICVADMWPGVPTDQLSALFKILL